MPSPLTESGKPDAARLIDFSHSIRSPITRRLYSVIQYPFESIIALRTLNSLYAESLEQFDEGQDANYFFSALKTLNVSIQTDEADVARIPRNGPLVIVSNHPFGGIDGIALTSILTTVRDDGNVKILGNYLLNRIPQIRPYVIAVDPFGMRQSSRRNIGPIRDCMRWLQGGGALVTFPSGTVSHVHLRHGGRVTDPAWNPNTIPLIRRTGATVLPVFFEGQNSSLFLVAGLINPWLRTLMLPRELVNKRNRTLRVRIGMPISAARISQFGSDQEAIDFLRLNTYILKNRKTTQNRRFIPLPASLKRKSPDNTSGSKGTARKAKKRQEPLARPVPPEVIKTEIEHLPQSCLLATHGEFSVFCADSLVIPGILKEIARLREKTFREAGEGTGQQMDTDQFDAYYLHLFLWNNEKCEIAGAYRMGPTDRIIKQHGYRGLYTTTLFRMKPFLLDKFNPALEMGRSFIRSEYQRKQTSLALLWRGIGEYVVRNPQYRILFGPVSISGEYHPLSRNLIVQFLRRNTLNSELARYVKARNPPQTRSLGGLDRKSLLGTIHDISDVSALISELETDRKGVPVLLRQYLRLNGTMLSFNVDPDFSEVIDGLVVVDLLDTEQRILQRFMGKDGLESFLEFHKNRQHKVQHAQETFVL